MKVTIIYCTSNRENEDFENKIKEDLLEKSKDIPIISVSQKPINLGKNICVGNVGASGFNFLRQVLIGCEAANTQFIISAEADCLYSPDYFDFMPIKDNVCYRNNNTYLMGYRRNYFYKKNEGGTWCQVVNREFYIKQLKELLDKQPEWSTEMKNFPKEIGKKLFDSFEIFTTKYPCISIKTGKGMRKYSHSERIPINSLFYWGSGLEIRKKYL